MFLSCYNKIPQTGGLNHRNIFFTVPEAGKSKINELTDLILGEGSLQLADVCSLAVPSHGLSSVLCMVRDAGRRTGERERACALVSLIIRTLNPEPTLRNSSNLRYLSRPHLQTALRWRLGVQQSFVGKQTLSP